MFDRKVSGRQATSCLAYLWYSNQAFSQHFWSFCDTRGFSQAFQPRTTAPFRSPILCAHRGRARLARTAPQRILAILRAVVSKYLPREFWTRLAKDFGESDLTGFAPVLHPGTPRWFNKAIDRLQTRTWSQTLNYCSLSQGARVLDVGCGTGRWVRRLEERGFSAVGIDQSPQMLSLARKRGTLSHMVSGEAQNLPFRDESFECVSGVTVIQHIPPPDQVRALSEMIRVLRPGGYLLLIELIRGHGLHVFSRLPDDWIGQVSTLGASLVSWRGHEYFPFDRGFVYLAQKLRALAGYVVSEDSLPPSGPAGGDHELPELARRVYWTLRRIAVALSVWAEPLLEKVCPGKLATHGVFLFRKQQALD
jgi:SAM-dependent methyltransferase